MSYNFKSGFPQSWPSGQFENKIIDQFLKKNKFDLVVNTTWSEVKFANTVFALENKLKELSYEFSELLVKIHKRVDNMIKCPLNHKKTTKHPTAEGHQIWAEYLYNYYKDL